MTSYDLSQPYNPRIIILLSNSQQYCIKHLSVNQGMIHYPVRALCGIDTGEKSIHIYSGHPFITCQAVLCCHICKCSLTTL